MHGALVASVRRVVHPRAVVWAKLLDQPRTIGTRELANGDDAQRFELFAGLRSDAIDLARGQRPNALLDVFGSQQRESVRLAEFGDDLGQQLVGRDAHRAR